MNDTGWRGMAARLRVMGALAVACAQPGPAAASTDEGCLMLKLAPGQGALCVRSKWGERELHVTVHDGAGQPVASACFPSWYGHAKVSAFGAAGMPVQYLGVTFEGNTGSGVSQTLLAVMRLDARQLKPVLLESVDYSMSGPGTEYRMKATPRLHQAPARPPSITIAYASPRRWTDTLLWDADSATFYSEAAETLRAAQAPTALRRSIAQVRLAVRSLGGTDLCADGAVQRTGIFELR